MPLRAVDFESTVMLLFKVFTTFCLCLLTFMIVFGTFLALQGTGGNGNMKPRTGTLVKRGHVYYLRWVFDGKVVVKRLTLKDEFGVERGITTIEAAEVARKKEMDGWTYADQKKATENLLTRIGDRTAELAKIETAKPGLPIKLSWEAFKKSPRRPDSGPVTMKYYKFQWDRFADWMEARKKDAHMRDVDADTAEAYAAFLTEGGASANTYNKHLALLQLVFRILGQIPAHKITVNPWANIQRRRLAPHSHRELTIDELRRVCDAATGEFRTLLAIGIYTGLRLSDAATLQWGEVDLVRALIQRVPRKTARRTGKPVQVPIHKTLGAILAETSEKVRRGPVLPETCAAYEADEWNLSKQIQAHFESCGIDTHAPGTGFVLKPQKEGPAKLVHSGKRAQVDVGYHSLRHTFVSLCRAANTPLSVVESIVGHSSPAMTRHYTHTGEDAARTAIALLPGLKAAPKKMPDEERREWLLGKIKKMKPARVKRAVLRFLAAGHKAEWVVAKKADGVKAKG